MATFSEYDDKALGSLIGSGCRKKMHCLQLRWMLHHAILLCLQNV
jgi:hypothetical protein